MANNYFPDNTESAMITPSLLDNPAKPQPQITAINDDEAMTLVQPQLQTQQQPQPKDETNGGVWSLLKPAKKTKTKTTPKTRPAFVVKLWTMVNDPANNELINWCEDGTTFLITHREKFVQQILPKYFKHSNFASFVRQLNMYGWHKVQDPSSGALHSDERWQFENPHFQRDRPELLDKIVRHKPQENSSDEGVSSSNGNINQWDVSLLISELNNLKSNQLKITQELSRVRQDNDLLWQELYATRERNLIQNEKVEKILQFLSSIYGNNRVQVLEDQMNNHGAVVQPYTPSDFTSTPSDLQQPAPFKPRLMIKQHRHVSNSSSSSTNNTPQRSVYEIDNSPVEEIVRTPDNIVQPNYPQSYMNDQLERAEEDELYQIPKDSSNSLMAPPLQPVPNNYNSVKSPFRPSFTSTPSLDDLTKSIEEQGHSLNDIISRLQQNQYDQPQNFDLDDFLNEDVEKETGSPSTSTTPKVSLQEVQDDDLKRGVDDDIEEIINPPKKRKSGNY